MPAACSQHNGCKPLLLLLPAKELWRRVKQAQGQFVQGKGGGRRLCGGVVPGALLVAGACVRGKPLHASCSQSAQML